MLNFFKKVICYAIAFLIMCPCATAGEQPVTTSADASVAIDAATGRVICEQNAHQRLGMASTTKIMTLILALELGEPDDIVTVDKRAVGVEGSSLYLREGDTITLRNLLFGMMLRSGNDGAAAVALHFAPSIEEFAEMMTNKAKELGLENTCFKNPHGLHEEGHYTTAYDLAQITRYGFTLDGFAEIVCSWDFHIDEDIDTTYVTNNNKLLRFYEGADGVKTGYTPETGRTLVGSASRDGMRIITVTLNDGDDWNDHMAMFDYGFEKYKNEKACTAGESFGCAKINGGEEYEVPVVCKEDFTACIKKDNSVETEFEINKNINAPVKKGQELGKVIITENGEKIGEVPLVAAEEVKKAKEPEKGFIYYITDPEDNIFLRTVNWIMGK